MIIAILLIVAGLVFFARSLGFIDDLSLNVLWPLALVVLGLSMVSHKTFGHHCTDKGCWRCAEVSFSDKGSSRKRN